MKKKEEQFKVNFLIIGTQKGGTTALAHFLAQHPEICFAPKKEVHFFDGPDYEKILNNQTITQRYKLAFPNYKGQNLVGEATPSYMYLPLVIKRIYRYNPQMKLIILLREPVERAVSHYNMARIRGNESLDFLSAIKVEKWRLWGNYYNYEIGSPIRTNSYLDRGFYQQQIERILIYFPLKQILFLQREYLLFNHNQTLTQVYDFLQLEDRSFIPPQEIIFSHENQEDLSPFIIQKLKNRYIKDLNYLENLLNWDLSHWR